MGEELQFPKQKKKHIYKEDECAGCHKLVTEDEIHQRLQLPHRDYVEYIVLCETCVQVNIDHGVYL